MAQCYIDRRLICPACDERFDHHKDLFGPNLSQHHFLAHLALYHPQLVKIDIHHFNPMVPPSDEDLLRVAKLLWNGTCNVLCCCGVYFKADLFWSDITHFKDDESLLCHFSRHALAMPVKGHSRWVPV